MLRRLMPDVLNSAILKLDYSKICEIRLRRNSPVVVNYAGKNKPLTTNCFSGEKIYASGEIIDFVIKKATENSLYAYNNQLKQGFITAKGGIRLGVAGESVNSDNFMPTTIKNIQAVNIRVPHEVKDCSAVAFKFIYSNDYGVKSTLIISPPGAGKTTYLRDIARRLSLIDDKVFNVLLVDERFELASVLDGLPMLDVGKYTDVVSGASKKFAFTNGIRVLRPDVIITDEVMSEEDVWSCINAINSGVKVIASIHANNIREIEEKEGFSGIIKSRCFERYVILSNKESVGLCQSVFDKELNCIYF